MKRSDSLLWVAIVVVSGVTGSAPVALGHVRTGEAWVARFNGPVSGEDIGNAVAVSPDGTTVFVTGQADGMTGGTDYATLAYDAATGSMLWTAMSDGRGHGTDVAVVLAVSPDGSRLFVTGRSTGPDRKANYATIAYDATTGSPSGPGSTAGRMATRTKGGRSP